VIEPASIRGTALLTVEGERDDICAVGQTMAAHDLTPGIRPYLKQHHLQAGVGHYGVFSGRRWHNEIYPIVRDMIYQMEARRAMGVAPVRRSADLRATNGGRNRCGSRAMILELAEVTIRPGEQPAFDAAIARGIGTVISRANGFRRASVHKGIESPER